MRDFTEPDFVSQTAKVARVILRIQVDRARDPLNVFFDYLTTLSYLVNGGQPEGLIIVGIFE